MPSTPEAPLAGLGFQLIAPGPALRPYVQSYWRFCADTPLRAYREEYMHPCGGYGIVFNFGETLGWEAQPIAHPVFLDGANTRSRKLGFLGRVKLMGVRFHAGGAYPFLGMPLHELRNETALLDALNRPELLRLHARLAEAPTWSARLALLEDWLVHRLTLGKDRAALIPASLRQLRESAVPIPQLARALAVSQRQLERLYQTQVGMSPKQYTQLLRVETARLALKQLNGHTTTQLATELGFYDQAHFIREFSAVVGVTPYAYFKRKHHSTHLSSEATADG